MLHAVIRPDLYREMVAPPESAGLTSLERQVVRLSLGDGAATIGRGGHLRDLWRGLFGGAAVNRLGDPRLEMLRVFCVRYRLDGHAAAFSLAFDARTVGFGADTFFAAARLIEGWRGRDGNGVGHLPTA